MHITATYFIKSSKAFLSLFSLYILFIITGCLNQTPSLETLLHIDIYQNNDSASHIEKNKILSHMEPNKLENYYNKLIAAEPINTSISQNTDLVYTIEFQFAEEMRTYTLEFDLSNKSALATNEGGTYSIPFDWVNDYLNAKPSPEQFEHLFPSQFTLYLDDYKISYGMQQEWRIHPTDQVSYHVDERIDGYEILRSDNFDISLQGVFEYYEPTVINAVLTNEDTGDIMTFDDVTLASLPLPNDEGSYFYNLECIWNDTSSGYSGTINYMFDIVIELPVSYALNKSVFEPGDCMAILLSNIHNLDYRVETETFDKTIGLFYFDDAEGDASSSNPRDLAGLIPLDSRTAPGNYSVSVYQDSTDLLLWTADYTVTAKEFDTQHLTVSSTTASLKSQENYAKDAEKFAGAKDYSVGEPLWDSPFIMPVEGRISTEYAVIRYVNGNTKESSRHSGLDIANEQGTPIKAAHNGIVTFASDLIVSGNVVVLDHGYGLFTSYVHMHDIYVEKGQEVKQGDLIGEVGSTGYSTGPHLHFTVWKNGVYLNPWKFFETDPLAAFK